MLPTVVALIATFAIWQLPHQALGSQLTEMEKPGKHHAIIILIILEFAELLPRCQVLIELQRPLVTSRQKFMHPRLCNLNCTTGNSLC
jgi:hypothetical protein